MIYANRQEAGQKLGDALKEYEGKDTIVLALPRGGVVLGAEVAEKLKAPLDVVLVRKIGHPISEEYAIGAVVFGEEPVLNENEPTDDEWIKSAAAHEQQINESRYELYYGDEFEPIPLQGKVVIIVDDGIATGLTMEAAVRAAQKRHPKQIIVAVPVAPADSITSLEAIADKVIVLDNPDDFLGSVGAHYQQFTQVEDEEVRSLLKEHREQKNTSRNTYT